MLPTIRVGGQVSKGLYQYTLQDADLPTLYKWSPVLYDKLRTLPGFLDVNSDLQITSPQVLVEIDRDKAATLGVTAEQVASMAIPPAAGIVSDAAGQALFTSGADGRLHEVSCRP